MDHSQDTKAYVFGGFNSIKKTDTVKIHRQILKATKYIKIKGTFELIYLN